MDQSEGDIRRDIEGARAAMTENIGRVEARVQDTVESVKSTVEQAMAGVKQVQETVEGAKSAVHTILESVKLGMDETVERVHTAADFIGQMQQHPWIMLGGAILLGYIVGSLARETSSAPPRNASAHGGHEPSETHQ
jgi:ElaB/YqjD/DUF883 family membrane-anchored ribosome-binding protein